jgi:hypothetical protein
MLFSPHFLASRLPTIEQWSLLSYCLDGWGHLFFLLTEETVVMEAKVAKDKKEVKEVEVVTERSASTVELVVMAVTVVTVVQVDPEGQAGRVELLP